MNYSLELYKAIETRSFADLKRLIDDPLCDLNVTLVTNNESSIIEGSKITALHALVMPHIQNLEMDRTIWEQENARMIQMLLNSGRCNVNAVDRDGRTALHYAAIYQLGKAARLLINTPSCNLNVADTLRGYTPFHLAAFCSGPADTEPSVFDQLLERSSDRCDVNATVRQTQETVLHLTESQQILHKLLKNKDFVNYNSRDVRGCTALRGKLLTHLPQNAEESDFAADLIQSGRCDLSEIDPQTKNSLLHEAVHRKRHKALTALLASNHPSLSTVINAKDRCGSAPIHLLISEEGMKLMISNPFCDCNLTGPSGFTAFQIAIQNNNTNLAKIMMSCNQCDIYKTDICGNTPLHIAALYEHSVSHSGSNETQTLQMLLESGKFAVDAINNEGQTPLMLLYRQKSSSANNEKAELLIKSGAIVNPTDKYGNNPIYCPSQLTEAFVSKDNNDFTFAVGVAISPADFASQPYCVPDAKPTPKPTVKKENKSCIVM